PRDILARRFHVAHADWRIARGRLAMLAPRVGHHACLRVREGLDVLEHIGVAASAKTVEPILDVRRVARLPPLAVVDDVDPCLRLPGDDFVDRPAHTLFQSRPVHGDSVFPRPHHRNQIVGARKAADVRGEKAAVVRHRSSSSTEMTEATVIPLTPYASLPLPPYPPFPPFPSAP